MRRPGPARAERNAGAFLGPFVMIPVPMHTLADDYSDEPTEPEASDRVPEPAPTDLIHRFVDRHWLLGSVVVLVAVVAFALAVNAQPIVPVRINQATASVMAYQAFLTDQVAGTTVSNVSVDAVDPIVDGPRRAWQVSVSGDLTTAGITPTTHRSSAVIVVYDEDGETQVVPQS